METVPRITATPAALALINELRALHGPLLFHQSGGCCDGSAPMCFARHEFRIGGSDVGLGHVGDTPFWMSRDQFSYWQHTQLTLDVVPGRGSSFSLDIPTGRRFIIRSQLFTDEQAGRLSPLFYSDDE